MGRRRHTGGIVCSRDGDGSSVAGVRRAVGDGRGVEAELDVGLVSGRDRRTAICDGIGGVGRHVEGYLGVIRAVECDLGSTNNGSMENARWLAGRLLEQARQQNLHSAVTKP